MDFFWSLKPDSNSRPLSRSRCCSGSCRTSGTWAIWCETSRLSASGNFSPVAGEHLRVVRPARDGDVCHAIVDEVLGSQLRIDVDEHAIGGPALAGMAGGGIAVV